MGAVKVSTDPVGQLLGAEPSVWLDKGTRAVHPLGCDRVEPGILDRQIAGHDADTPCPGCLTRRLWARIQARTPTPPKS